MGYYIAVNSVCRCYTHEIDIGTTDQSVLGSLTQENIRHWDIKLITVQDIISGSCT